jgi:hypothetical protein
VSDRCAYALRGLCFVSTPGWDITQTIDTLVRKSGWKGVLDDALRRSITLTRFQATACTLSYADYQAMRQRTVNTLVADC